MISDQNLKFQYFEVSEAVHEQLHILYNLSYQSQKYD